MTENVKTKKSGRVKNQPDVGSVVRSVSGRDRKRVFIVVEYDSCNKNAPLVIANGTLRKLGDRKHKNPLHLETVATLSETEMHDIKEHPSDSLISEICGRYDNFKQK